MSFGNGFLGGSDESSDAFASARFTISGRPALLHSSYPWRCPRVGSQSSLLNLISVSLCFRNRPPGPTCLIASIPSEDDDTSIPLRILMTKVHISASMIAWAIDMHFASSSPPIPVTMSAPPSAVGTIVAIFS